MKHYDPEEYWSAVAHRIDRRGRDALAGDNAPFDGYRRSAFLRKFLYRLPVEGKRVLEVGCGPGGNLVEIAGRGANSSVGCDISPAMLELAIVTTKGSDNVALVRVGGTSLPFADRSMDITLAVTVLHHNHDDTMRPLLAEMCRVTRGSVHLFEDTSERRREWPSYIVRPVSEFQSVCEGSGFVLTAVSPLNVYVSDRVDDLLRRLLLPTSHREGEPVGRLYSVVERAMLPLTRWLDGLVRQKRGLTSMAFTRRGGG